MQDLTPGRCASIVSNVPAVMLLLPAATEPWSRPLLALASTLAGNLRIVGSIAKSSPSMPRRGTASASTGAFMRASGCQ